MNMGKRINQSHRVIGILLLLIYTLFIIQAFQLIDISILYYKTLINVVIDSFAFIISTLLYISVSTEKRTIESTTIMIMSHLECALLTGDIIGWLGEKRINIIIPVQAATLIVYCLLVLMILTYWYFIRNLIGYTNNKNHFNRCFIVVSIFTILTILFNLKFHYYYGYLSDGSYYRGSWFFVYSILAFILVSMILYRVLKSEGDHQLKTRLLIYILGPMLMNMIQLKYYGLSFLYPSILISVFFLYTNTYLIRGREIAKQNEILIKKEKDIQQKQTEIFVTCIQPHYIFNSLGTIEMLIKTGSNQAASATQKFAQYLRVNINSIINKEAIPFSKELEHINNYIYLELIRFNDYEFEIESIENTDFMIPALTIQPIVENAIKHGLMGREEGGKVVLKEVEEKEDHVIIIEDNGIGFDPNSYHQDGKEHIGIDNVRNRLEEMVNGTLTIESEINKGTKVMIRIPKKQGGK